MYICGNCIICPYTKFSKLYSVFFQFHIHSHGFRSMIHRLRLLTIYRISARHCSGINIILYLNPSTLNCISNYLRRRSNIVRIATLICKPLFTIVIIIISPTIKARVSFSRELVIVITIRHFSLSNSLWFED